MALRSNEEHCAGRISRETTVVPAVPRRLTSHGRTTGVEFVLGNLTDEPCELALANDMLYAVVNENPDMMNPRFLAERHTASSSSYHGVLKTISFGPETKKRITYGELNGL